MTWIGKTQLCLSCCAATALRGRGVVFIDTELKFDPLRLDSLVKSRLPAEPVIHGGDEGLVAKPEQQVLEKVQVTNYLH